MLSKNQIWSLALVESLIEAPLLAGDLPEAPAFDRSELGSVDCVPQFKFEQKLGHLYEDTLGHLLEHSSAQPLLASGLQLSDEDGRTLGELDFLLGQRSARKGLHLELAVKFYLAHFDGGEWHYPGPTARDNWLRKLERLRAHQLRLCQHPRARAHLLEQYGLEEIKVRQLIYGRLFYPMEGKPPPLPPYMRRDGLRGRWLHRASWKRCFGNPREATIIPKPLWPVRMRPGVLKTLKPVRVENLLEQAATRCILCLLDDPGQPIFVVPDGWPGR